MTPQSQYCGVEPCVQNDCNGIPARRSRMPSRVGGAHTRMDRDCLMGCGVFTLLP